MGKAFTSRDALNFIRNQRDPNLVATRRGVVANEKAARGVMPQNAVPKIANPTGDAMRLYGDYLLTSSGNTVTFAASESKIISLYVDSEFGWNNKTLEASITLSTAGYTTDKKYDFFTYWDNSTDTFVLASQIWTNDTTRAVALDTVDGVRLLSTDYTYRYVGTGRYNGTSMAVASQDNTGIAWYGTGNPYDPTGADPFTGVIISQDGVFGYSAGTLQSKMSTLGQILAGAGAVILDALGITLTQGVATQNAIKWVYGATEILRIGASGTSAATSTISTFSPSAGAIADMDMRVTGNGAVTAEVNIRSYPSGQSIIEINKGVVDVDTAVHGSSANLIYADASANAVGFGTDTPSEKVDVVGNGKFSGTLAASNLSGTNTGNQTITLTGDVTGSGTGSFAATIANAAVTLAKMANMATASLIYRKTAGSGAPEVNTLATLKTDLAIPVFIGANMGGATVALSSTVFIGPYMSIPVASFALSAWDVPNAGTLKNFYIRTNSTQPASGSLVFTIYQNSSGTTLTITIAAGAAANNAASDTTHSVSVAAGDRLSIQVVNNATAASAQITGLSFEFNAA